MADGSLKFDTKIDTDGFEDGADSLKSIMKRLASSIEELGRNIKNAFTGVEFTKTNQELSKTSNAIDDVDGRARRMEESMKNIDAAIERMNSEAVSDIMPESEVVAAKELSEAIDDITPAAIEAKDAVGDISSSGAKIDEAEKEVSELGNTMNFIKRTFSDAPSIFAMAGNKIKDAFAGAISSIRNTGDTADSSNQKIKSLVDEIDLYKEALYNLEGKGMYFGDKEYDETYQKLNRAEQALNNYKKGLVGLDKQQRKTSVSSKKMSDNLKKTTKASVPLTKSILKVSNMFKLMVLRMAMKAVINAVKEGFQNLAQYSNQANKDMSALATSSQTLKNSFAAAFAPILTAVTPALQTLINYLSQALTVLGQFFAVLLTGATTFTKAKDAQVDYAKSLGKSAKEANKALSPIDKLNTVTDSEAGGSGTPSAKDMFETIDIDPKIATAATTITDTIKNSFKNMLAWFTETFGPTFSEIWGGLQTPINNFKNIVSGIWADIQTLWQPFLNYISGHFVPFLQQYFGFIGQVVTGLFDTFNTVFSDIWNLAVYPILQSIFTDVLPILTNFATEFYSLMGVVFSEVKAIFDMLWADVAAPALEFFAKVWTDVAEIMAEFWNKWGKPIFDGLKEAWQKTADLFKTVWNKLLKPIWDTFMKTVDKLWTNHLKPLLANFMDFVGALVDGALAIYNKFIVPIVKWFVEKLGPPIAKVVSWLIDVIGNFLGDLIDVVSKIIDALKGVVEFIVGVFTGDWEKAWEGIKKIFKGVWDALVGIVKTPVNLIIDIINGLIKGIVAGINVVIKGINSISFSIPGWVPGIGGKSVGFNLKQMSAPKIPRLATGTVVPANYGEFLAILGDNTREAEIVSPISAMKQAFKEAMAEMGGTGTGAINLNVYLEGRQIHSEVVRQDRQYKKETGKSAFAY